MLDHENLHMAEGRWVWAGEQVPPRGVVEVWRHEVAFPSVSPLSVTMVRFEAARFDPREYGRWDIALPLAVSRSISKRQAEFFMGRYAARWALLDLGLRPSTVGVGSSREPLWPSGVVGSISHCRDTAVAAVAGADRCIGVGVDVEDVVDLDTMDSLQRIVLCPEEEEMLRSISSAATLATLFTLCFSAKESFFKAVYNDVKMYLNFHDVKIEKFDLVKKSIFLTVSECLSESISKNSRFCIAYANLGTQKVMTILTWIK